MGLPKWDGWNLIGLFESDVGSWLLVNGGEAVLLEVPEGLKVADVRRALRQTKTALRLITASHDHWDHIDQSVWQRLSKAFPHATILHPSEVVGDQSFSVGGEPLWLIKAPKHSVCDVVTVFRGVAMTGDIELGTLESVNDDVPISVRQASMEFLAGFQDRAGYHVNSIVSAHLDDIRTGVDWPHLFNFPRGKSKPDNLL